MKLPGSLVVAVLFSFLFAAANASGSDAPAQAITIDAGHVVGAIKRVNDVDNGPLNLRGVIDLSRYYKELGIRNVRLHDVPWSFDDVLDINYVFPRWDADPDDPASYNFVLSDFYIKSVTDLGINIIFRLGYSAEAKTAARHIAPPASYAKYADICAQIVKHYNQGWAHGPRANIRYWEIGNEPDGKDFWSGTPEEYYRLYEIVAHKLKEIDPTLKIGGPTLAGNMPFLEGFLKYGQAQQMPVDFVSWHIYTRNPHDIAKKAKEVHALQAQYGFKKAESILDEWNLGPTNWDTIFADAEASRTYFDEIGNQTGAAFDTAAMTEMQDAPVDIATFYTGTTQPWGLFTSSGAPHPAYYSFLAMQRMMETPQRLETKSEGALYVLAGVSEDKTTIHVLVTELAGESSTFTLQLVNLPWKGATICERRVIDAKHTFGIADTSHLKGESPSIAGSLEGPVVTLFTLRPDSK